MVSTSNGETVRRSGSEYRVHIGRIVAHDMDKLFFELDVGNSILR